jgi:hypothetical protein
MLTSFMIFFLFIFCFFSFSFLCVSVGIQQLKDSLVAQFQTHACTHTVTHVYQVLRGTQKRHSIALLRWAKGRKYHIAYRSQLLIAPQHLKEICDMSFAQQKDSIEIDRRNANGKETIRTFERKGVELSSGRLRRRLQRTLSNGPSEKVDVVPRNF